MNKRNILKVAKAIEDAAKKQEGLRGEIGFNMNVVAAHDGHGDHVDTCGTVACIAGWAYAIRYPSVTAARLVKVADGAAFLGLHMEHRVPSIAARFLGLSDDEALALFAPDSLLISYRDITPAHAVAVLRHLAKTGKVDWSVGAP